MTETTTATGLDVQALTGDYTIDTAHSRLGFVARHAMVTKVRGSFDEFEGTAHLDFADPTASTAELTIQVQSINTRQKQRDEHLRTNDFFDAPTYPQITFTSTKAEVIGADTYRLTGDLTIKDVTKPVSIDLGAAPVEGRGGRVIKRAVELEARQVPAGMMLRVSSDRRGFAAGTGLCLGSARFPGGG